MYEVDGAVSVSTPFRLPRTTDKGKPDNVLSCLIKTVREESEREVEEKVWNKRLKD
jgi:hypothetical protein